MSQVQEDLCDDCTNGDFEDADLTPKFDIYSGYFEDGFEGNPDETLPPTPEVHDNYVGENVLLPRGKFLVQGIVLKSA